MDSYSTGYEKIQVNPINTAAEAGALVSQTPVNKEYCS